MKTNKIYQGDSLEVLKTLPDKSIHMCMTSPPYWALRDYGVNEQLGLEGTFDEYINKLCDIFDEVKRVLRDDGTCWVNLGDTYYGSGAGTQKNNVEPTGKQVYVMPYGSNRTREWNRPSRSEYEKAGIKKKCLICNKNFFGKENSQFCSKKCLNTKGNNFRSQNRQLPDKCMVMIPFRFAIEMVNRGWILRNTIIWHKNNAMPSSVNDRFTVDFEYLFFFSKKKKYYFEKQQEKRKDTWGGRWGKMPKGDRPNAMRGRKEMTKEEFETHYGDKRNKRTTWTINTKSFKDAHFAVYPEELCETPINAGCPEFVCKKCGKPREKIIEVIGDRVGSSKRLGEKYEYGRPQRGKYKNDYKTTGLSDCGCNAGFEGGIVLDPFFGAGTTGLVALKQSKKFVGSELNPDYIKIAEKRLKPFLEQRKLGEY